MYNVYCIYKYEYESFCIGRCVRTTQREFIVQTAEYGQYVVR